MTQETISAAELRRRLGQPPPGADREKPSRKPPVQRELALQMASASWFRNLVSIEALPFHVPNGEYRSRLTAARLHAMGVLPGAPDWAIPTAGGRILWLELKAAGGRQSKDQAAFQQRLEAWGHRYEICSSIQEMHDALAGFGIVFVEGAIAASIRRADQ